MNLVLLRGEEGALERTLRKKESFEACEPKNPSGKFDKIPEDHKKKTGDRRNRKNTIKRPEGLFDWIGENNRYKKKT